MTISKDAIVEWIKAYAGIVAANKALLTELDAAIGDADHGINMDRGFQKVVETLPSVANQDIGAIFKSVGMTLISTVGGASGPLYGTLFLQLSTMTAGKQELTLPDWVAALEAGIEGIKKRGKASLGEKTMIDSLWPGLESLKAAMAQGAALPDALRQSEQAAAKGLQDTIPMVARRGRASYLGERSVGHQDPGATSSHLLLKAAADVWSNT